MTHPDPAAVAALLALATDTTPCPEGDWPCNGCFYTDDGNVDELCKACEAKKEAERVYFCARSQNQKAILDAAPALCASWLQMRAALEGLLANATHSKTHGWQVKPADVEALRAALAGRAGEPDETT